MSRPKDVLTTGEVARICNVAPRTVSKWFDTGKLRGYRIPGSKDRRIPLQQLVRFMRTHGIPLNGLDTGVTRVLLVESDQGISDLLSTALAREAGYDVQIARTAFEAGAMAEAFKPQVLLLDVDLPGLSGRETVNAIRDIQDLATAKLIALSSSASNGHVEAFRQQGFDAALAKPFEVSQAVRTIEEALNGAGDVVH
jgi:excisionase family DNA binding protein